MDRRSFIAGCAGLSLTATASDVFGQSGALTKIIFPFAAGGGGDALCRVVAQHLGASLDRNFVPVAERVERIVDAHGFRWSCAGSRETVMRPALKA